ncbi:leukemia-associated protein 7 [Misgurnus anguillicaudatus]|uniref:leukemia-associated protein 7 n=1 Tax=Misgurnus anguillicaudatus TaxID=75329 RepID=UPI003CCF17D0
MGRCPLTHQTDALKILYELRAPKINRSCDGDGEGQCGLTTPPVRGHESAKQSRRLKTIAERARESCFTRLIDILTQLISIEQDFIKSASRHETSLLRCKDSVDLKNICLRMALGEGASRSDRDLRELRDCLRLIVSNLLDYVRDENSLTSTVTRHKLRELYKSFPDI